MTEDQIEVLRIEQGVPKWGAELTPDRLPPEAHLEGQAIDYNKGCYVGQEVISRLRSVGHVNRLLVSLIANNEKEELMSGMKLVARDELGKVIGFITSAAKQSDSRKFIALGYVTRDNAVPGKRLLALNEDSKRIVTTNIILSPLSLG